MFSVRQTGYLSHCSSRRRKNYTRAFFRAFTHRKDGESSARGWHIQLMLGPEHLVELAPRLLKLRCDFVIDHLSDIHAAEAEGQPAFQALLRLLHEGRGWTKLSAGYHLSEQEPPYPEVIPLVHALVKATPDRLLWGTDWPHVNHYGKMPNTTELFDQLLEWVPDEAVRTRILVDNPARLYGF